MKLNIKLKQIDEIRKEFNGLDKAAAMVERKTLSNVKRKAVTEVKRATSAVYAINQNEVARSQQTASKYAGKQHVKTGFRGQSLDDFVMVFTGKKTATWNTKAKPKPKKPKTGNPKVFSTKKKYSVTQEVFRGQRTPIKPKGDNRVFVAMVGGKLRPLVVGNDNRPMIKASTSVPQAIMNEQVVKIWRPEVEQYVVKEFDRLTKLYWKGEAPFAGKKRTPKSYKKKTHS